MGAKWLIFALVSSFALGFVIGFRQEHEQLLLARQSARQSIWEFPRVIEGWVNHDQSL